jgi:macrodomain Ter protein organizer (MatP/YcbG family)
MFELNVNVPQNEQVVLVNTTDGRGFTPEELSEQCVQKLISVSDTAPPAIRDQARAFSKHIETLVAFYMRQAIRSDRTTVYNALNDAGHPDLADLIRRL